MKILVMTILVFLSGSLLADIKERSRQKHKELMLSPSQKSGDFEFQITNSSFRAIISGDSAVNIFNRLAFTNTKESHFINSETGEIITYREGDSVSCKFQGSGFRLSKIAQTVGLDFLVNKETQEDRLEQNIPIEIQENLAPENQDLPNKHCILYFGSLKDSVAQELLEKQQ
ncbi:MAG: hypothetical protein AB8E15_13895 [Bdellovibrionales bacterium]